MTVATTEWFDQLVLTIQVECLPDVSHWVQNDAPERTNDLLLDVFRRQHER